MKNYEIVWHAADDELGVGVRDNRPSAAGVLVQLYKKAGDLSAARRAALYAIEKGSDRVAARALCFLAALDAEEGNDETARKAFDHALKKAAGGFDLPEARLGLARIDERQGHLEAALRGYEQFRDAEDLRLRATVSFARGRVLARLGDRAGAHAAYEAALEGPITDRLRNTIRQHLNALNEGTIGSQDDRPEDGQASG